MILHVKSLQTVLGFYVAFSGFFKKIFATFSRPTCSMISQFVVNKKNDGHPNM